MLSGIQDIIIKETGLEQVWSLRHRVMYPSLSPEAVKLEDDADGLHLGLYAEGKLVSVISLFQRGEVLQFRKFATETEEQGKGYGTSLLLHVMQYADEGNWLYIWCNARISAAAFYEKFGMGVSGDSWQQYGIEFIKMEKKLK
ncbi:MAG: GNAT family N-acetyltransferase [Chitinophagaceae bacterium]